MPLYPSNNLWPSTNLWPSGHEASIIAKINTPGVPDIGPVGQLFIPDRRPVYEWILCESPDSSDPFAPLVKLGTLRGAKGRTFELVRNRAGSAQFSLRLSDPMAYEILDQVDLNDVRGTCRKCIRIRRNEVDLWSGPIWGIQGSLPEGIMQISCVGWLETLAHALIFQVLDYSNDGNGRATDYIISDMLSKVNTQDTDHPLLIQMGTVTGSMPTRNRYYQYGTAVGPSIQELSDIEDGVDYEVDPESRALNLMAWDSYTTREEIRFGYRRGPNNIQKLGWQESTDRTLNRGVIISQGARVGPIEDATALDQYNMRFEEYINLTGANQDVLAPYLNAELAIRSRPIVTYSLTPFPRSAVRKVPALFDDFQIGDKIYFSAEHAAFKVKGQGIRVFGASVALDDNGNETISSLMTAPSS